MNEEITKEMMIAQRRRDAAVRGVRTRRTNTMKRKIKKILETLPEDQRFIANEIASNFIFLSVRITELRETMDREEMVIRYDNGGGQTGLRENPSIAVYNKLVTRHADLCMKLAKLLPDGSEEAKDELEAFIGI